ncbi:hypothetical protein KIPB_006915 [Kipferlia bialata]|uniref:PDEase domain-containing protein n=1 Tax=Kipferlia bialata TaxID=797122 RepID=A0A9K3CXY9_9EUKA|nr:hypothetical protein KIPB_006915 [Kipferlia bialata]|eukprot:g6915.t1
MPLSSDPDLLRLLTQLRASSDSVHEGLGVDGNAVDRMIRECQMRIEGHSLITCATDKHNPYTTGDTAPHPTPRDLLLLPASTESRCGTASQSQSGERDYGAAITIPEFVTRPVTFSRQSGTMGGWHLPLSNHSPSMPKPLLPSASEASSSSSSSRHGYLHRRRTGGLGQSIMHQTVREGSGVVEGGTKRTPEGPSMAETSHHTTDTYPETVPDAYPEGDESHTHLYIHGQEGSGEVSEGEDSESLYHSMVSDCHRSGSLWGSPHHFTSQSSSFQGSASDLGNSSQELGRSQLLPLKALQYSTVDLNANPTLDSTSLEQEETDVKNKEDGTETGSGVGTSVLSDEALLGSDGEDVHYTQSDSDDAYASDEYEGNLVLSTAYLIRTRSSSSEAETERVSVAPPVAAPVPSPPDTVGTKVTDRDTGRDAASEAMSMAVPSQGALADRRPSLLLSLCTEASGTEHPTTSHYTSGFAGSDSDCIGEYSHEAETGSHPSGRRGSRPVRHTGLRQTQGRGGERVGLTREGEGETWVSDTEESDTEGPHPLSPAKGSDPDSRDWSVAPTLYMQRLLQTSSNSDYEGLGTLVDRMSPTLEVAHGATSGDILRLISDLERRLACEASGSCPVDHEWSAPSAGAPHPSPSLPHPPADSVSTGSVADSLEGQERAFIAEHVLTLEFDAHSWCKRHVDCGLPYLGYILHRHFHLDGVVSVRRFIAAIVIINSLYRPSSSYHNCVHAADVLQMVAMMVDRLRETVRMSYRCAADGGNDGGQTDVLQMVAMMVDRLRQTERGRSLCPARMVAVTLLAAASHDVEHCGVSSDLLVNIRHPLYHLFGSHSTLEMYHSQLGAYLLRYYGVFEYLSPSDADVCIDLFRRLILATDPKSLFDHARTLDTLREGGRDGSMAKDKEGKTGEEKLQEHVLSAILRCADISNASRPFPVAKAHSLNVMREFFRTGDLEVKHGLERGAFRDREGGVVAVKTCQISFISHVVSFYTERAREFFTHLCQSEGEKGETEGETDGSDGGSSVDKSDAPLPLPHLLGCMLTQMQRNKQRWEEISPEDPEVQECVTEAPLKGSQRRQRGREGKTVYSGE